MKYDFSIYWNSVYILYIEMENLKKYDKEYKHVEFLMEFVQIKLLNDEILQSLCNIIQQIHNTFLRCSLL